MASVFQDSDLDLETFDFANETKVLTALSLLPKKLKGKFLQKMKVLCNRAFLHYVNAHVSVRSLVLHDLQLIAPDHILSSLDVLRRVINNPRMSPTSSKTFGICEFKTEAIFNFVKQEYDKYMR